MNNLRSDRKHREMGYGIDCFGLGQRSERSSFPLSSDTEWKGLVHLTTFFGRFCRRTGIVAASIFSAILLSFMTDARAQAMTTVEINTGHCDFIVILQPNSTRPLSVALRDEDHGINYHPGESILVAAESSEITLPVGTPFGNEGDSIWILPQSQNPSLLYLGISAEGVPPGVFSKPFHFRLLRVEGPGDFFVWQAAEFGKLDLKMNTRDGVDDNDKTAPIIGSHEHFNWGFTTNGIYRVTFQVEGQRTGEATNIVSDPAVFTFHVLPFSPEPVDPPKLLLPLVAPQGAFTFRLIGAVGSKYRIEATEDFQTWSESATVILEMSPQEISLPTSQPQLQFYRARRL